MVPINVGIARCRMSGKARYFRIVLHVMVGCVREKAMAVQKFLRRMVADVSSTGCFPCNMCRGGV
jgi:hypothetical protein